MPKVTLRQAQLADIPAMVALEHVLFPEDDPWSAASFSAELSRGNNLYLIAEAEVDGLITPGVAGYCGLALLGSPGAAEAEVHTIGVDPAMQGQGVGKLLLDEMLTTARHYHAPVFLEVRTDNDAAIGLYRSRGFEVTGVRKNYYQPSGADAYLMSTTV